MGLLLGVTAWRNRAERIWKASNVALVMHPLTGREQGCSVNKVDGLESMDKVASGVNIRLENGNCPGDATGMRCSFVRVRNQ